jgi:hypothetical protein
VPKVPKEESDDSEDDDEDDDDDDDEDEDDSEEEESEPEVVKKPSENAPAAKSPLLTGHRVSVTSDMDDVSLDSGEYIHSARHIRRTRLHA